MPIRKVKKIVAAPIITSQNAYEDIKQESPPYNFKSKQFEEYDQLYEKNFRNSIQNLRLQQIQNQLKDLEAQKQK